jgi:hypothetical protein
MKKTVVFLLIFFFSSVKLLSAQTSSTASQNLNLNFSNVISITFVSTGTASGSALSLPFNTVSDYVNGVTSSVQQLKVQSNKLFNITVKANSANFTYSGSVTPAPVMPVSTLNIKVTANSTGGTIAGAYGSSFTGITNAASSLLSNCSNGGNQVFSIQYQATPGFAYPAGTYTVNIVFTATQI